MAGLLMKFEDKFQLAETVGVQLPTLANFFLAASDASGSPTMVRLFGKKPPQALYILMFLLLFLVGEAHLARALLWYRFCESPSATFSCIAKEANAIALLCVMWWRMRHFRTCNVNKHLESLVS